MILAVGYALREYGSFNYLYTRGNLIVFICSQIFIYICPYVPHSPPPSPSPSPKLTGDLVLPSPALELVNYHVLGRVFHYVPHLSPLQPSNVMRTFGGLMAVVETLNSVGVSLFANPVAEQSQQSLGKNLLLAAMVIQVVVVVTFFVMAGIFHFRCARAGFTRHHRAVTTPLYTLYASMVLILIRCIYRLVEKTMFKSVRVRDVEELKQLSPLLRHEAFFYIFEATLMLVNSGIWNIWHPGRFLPRSHRVRLGPDGVETMAEKKVDGRPMLMRVGNVLTFGVLFHRKEEKRREWIEMGDS